MHLNIVDRYKNRVLAGSLLLPLACADGLDQGQSADQLRAVDVELDIGAGGTPGIMLEDIELRPGRHRRSIRQCLRRHRQWPVPARDLRSGRNSAISISSIT